MRGCFLLTTCLAVLGSAIVVFSVISVKRSLKELSNQVLTEEIGEMIQNKYNSLVIGSSMMTIACMAIIILRSISD